MDKDHVYYAFGGSDIVVYIDNIVFSEVKEVFINTKKKQVEFKTILFNTSIKTSKELTSKKDAKVLFVFANEYGEKMYRVINKIKFSHEEVKYSIDKLIMYNSYIFDFEEISLYESFDRLDELREEVFNS